MDLPPDFNWLLRELEEKWLPLYSIHEVFFSLSSLQYVLYHLKSITMEGPWQVLCTLPIFEPLFFIISQTFLHLDNVAYLMLQSIIYHQVCLMYTSSPLVYISVWLTNQKYILGTTMRTKSLLKVMATRAVCFDFIFGPVGSIKSWQTPDIHSRPRLNSISK